MNKMQMWKKILIFILLFVFPIGMIGDISRLSAADDMGNLEDVGEEERGSIAVKEKTATEDEEIHREVKETATQSTEIQKKADNKKSKEITVKTRGTTKGKIKKTSNGQTVLDVSQGNIIIKKNGASGGGLADDETGLNPKGYNIAGTTSRYNVVVEPGVKTDITLDNVNITSDTTNYNCVDVSHAEVTITLIGDNILICNAGKGGSGYADYAGCALNKDGMDGELTIQCQFHNIKGHQCSNVCGSLKASGNPDLWHAGAIGSSLRNAFTRSEAGFSNLTIKGGNIEAFAGIHSPGIGGACQTTKEGGQKTTNIKITGGNVKVKGNSQCTGIGAGGACEVDGIFISGGTVEAEGGSGAPGIGTVDYPFRNFTISGGGTIVTAIGYTSMPGIGSASSTIEHVSARPDVGYQGYIQDGTSLDDYTFTDETPFSSNTNIRVNKFYTKVYFGSYRDENGIDKATKEQIGANHIITKSGGKAFTDEILKELSKVTGKQSDGSDFPKEMLTFADPPQIESINRAKTSGDTGDFLLTFMTPNGTKATITVSLRNDGFDAAEYDKDDPTAFLGANNFTQETGGKAFTETELKTLGGLKGKDKDGNNVVLDDFKLDKAQVDKINEAKLAGKAGTFVLTYEAPDGSKVTVTVSLIGEFDEVYEDPDYRELIKAKNIISKTGGKAFTISQVINLSKVKAFDKDGNQIPADHISISEIDQLQYLNDAKTEGRTGNFHLSFQTVQGTQITITVFLSEEGTDAEMFDPSSPSSTLGASNTAYPTGGHAFTNDELIELCSARGKDKNGDNAVLSLDEQQINNLNISKSKQKTGDFPMTFSLPDGTSVTVTVTLTGEHKVIFNSNGGNYKPDNQNITGGNIIKKPKDPVRKGYTFEGWFYTDEKGKEIRWDFNHPLHQDITLTAKWKKNSTPATTEDTKNTEKDTNKKVKNTIKKKKESIKKQQNKEEKLPEWGQYQITGKDGKKSWLSRTSDTKNIEGMIILFIISGGTGVIYLLYKTKKK